MDYKPREGVDYIVDLYQVAAIPRDVNQEELKHALNERMREYHPDRLQGLAPEFKSAGERMVRLLNRAKVVLFDEVKRREYDEILSTWTGPVSKDGTPVIRIDDAVRAEAMLQTPEELEAAFTRQTASVISMVRHNPRQQAMLGGLLKADGGDDELRGAYDDALFAEDQVYAIEAAERSRLIGLPENERYETCLGYTDTIQLAIEGARAVQAEEYQRRALGGVCGRLALLAGETPVVQPGSDIVHSGGSLPHYFDVQAKKVADLAAKREALLEKRLEIFRPTYPIAEVQNEGQPKFVIGIASDADSDPLMWIGFSFDPATVALTNVAKSDEIDQLLKAGEYEQVYGRGYNVLICAVKEHIELQTLLTEACNKHLVQYFPDVMYS